jgi:hypothetical protein
MNAQQVLSCYAEASGLGALDLDGNGCARLVFDEDLELDIEQEDGGKGLFLYCVLGPVPPGAGAALYRALLEANCFGQGTRHATLSVDAARGELLIHRRIDLVQVDPAWFAEAMDELLVAARQWRQACRDGRLENAPAADDAAGRAVLSGHRRGSFLRA